MTEMFSDVMVEGLCGVCVVGIVAGIWLIWQGLSGILKD
jgi:hypothetical protein